MSTKQNSSNISGVSKTLFIPLVARANAELIVKNFNDYESKNILNLSIQQNLISEEDVHTIFDDKNALKGSLIRAKLMDQKAKDFFNNLPNNSIRQGVSLGAGLCTRYHRLKLDQLYWIDVDFKDVINAKKNFLPESEYYQYYAGSLTDLKWTEKIKDKERPLWIGIEGVLMYLKEKEVYTFLKELALILAPGSIICFDYTHDFVVRNNVKPPSVKKLNSKFSWGLKNRNELKELTSKLTLKDISYFNEIGIGYYLSSKVFSWVTGGDFFALAELEVMP